LPEKGIPVRVLYLNKKKIIVLVFILLCFSVHDLAPEKISAGLLNFKTVFLSIIIEALPFVLAGAFVSAILHVFVSDRAIRKILPRKKIPSIPVAGFLGIIFPVCECGIVSVARRLIGKGVSLYSGITFMLAGPVVNLVVASSTAATFAQTLLPRDLVLNLGQDLHSSILSMMAFAFGISVCSSADAFIAASFASNFTAGSLVLYH